MAVLSKLPHQNSVTHAAGAGKQTITPAAQVLEEVRPDEAFADKPDSGLPPVLPHNIGQNPRKFKQKIPLHPIPIYG
jgi:hypothetical protein